MILRIAVISQSQYSGAAYSQSTRTVNIAESRGMIYDRNMRPMVNRESRTVLMVNPTADALETLKNELNNKEYEAAVRSAKDGKPFLLNCENYNGVCGDILSFTVYDRYSESDVGAHIIGYVDGDGNGVSGIEEAFDSFLKENSGSLSVSYSAGVGGRALTGNGFSVSDENYYSEAGLVLTVDSEIQRICETVLKRNDIGKGAAVVLDAKTSEILAMASVPTFESRNPSAALGSSDSTFLNRALNAYSVGSIFKPVVAAAALEEGISPDTVFDCAGFVNVNGIRFNCHNKSGHGENAMSGAMSVSCNAYFIELGGVTGSESIISVASRLGFGREIVLCDSMVSVSGNLPTDDNIDSRPALANLSFGQGTLLATPLQIAAAYCAIANGGYYREPYILKAMTDKNGEVTAYYKNEINDKVLTDAVCEEIKEMLFETVNSGTGKLAKPMCYDAAGKTATAETGWVSDGRDIVHTWFAGYYPSDEPEYVIVVFNEDGSSSATDCAPVFRDIADGITGMKRKD